MCIIIIITCRRAIPLSLSKDVKKNKDCRHSKGNRKGLQKYNPHNNIKKDNAIKIPTKLYIIIVNIRYP